jgi:hypothetical protein
MRREEALNVQTKIFVGIDIYFVYAKVSTYIREKSYIQFI